MYDVANEDTFRNIKQWLQEVCSHPTEVGGETFNLVDAREHDHENSPMH